MNVAKLIFSLQTRAANTSTNALELQILSKAIEKLKIGCIESVSTVDLPSNLSTDGNIYYVTDVQQLVYNVGSTWKYFNNQNNIVYGWGSNGQGQIGDGTTVSKTSPVTISGGITTWRQIFTSVDGSHTSAIDGTGTGWSWGYNSAGKLGIGSTTNVSVPTQILGIKNWSDISAGSSHGAGVTSTGIAYTWGSGTRGELGDNSTTSKSSPVTVVGGITTWSKIAAGNQFTVGLTTGGLIYSWGANGYGQLGDGTTTSKSSPGTIVGGITTWSQIAAGRDHVVAMTSAGVAYAWGRNGSGRLGDNSITNRSSPVSVVGGITWAQVSAGREHSLGVATNGRGYGWGYNTYGRLGDSTTTARFSPVQISGYITNWSRLLAGGQNSAGLTTAGLAYAWGRAAGGMVGDNQAATNRSSPVLISGGISNWTYVNIGQGAGFAISTTY